MSVAPFRAGQSMVGYYHEVSRYMNVKKLKIIKAGINSLLVSVLALAAIYAGADPQRVGLAAIAVIGALGGVEWYELPAVKLVNRKQPPEDNDK